MRTPQAAARWNAKHIVGTPVAVLRDDGSVLHTKTRSEAWTLGGGQAVVMVEGISGGYDLARVVRAERAVR